MRGSVSFWRKGIHMPLGSEEETERTKKKSSDVKGESTLGVLGQGVSAPHETGGLIPTRVALTNI